MMASDSAGRSRPRSARRDSSRGGILGILGVSVLCGASAVGSPPDEPFHAAPSAAVSVRLVEPGLPYWTGRVTFVAAAASRPEDPVARVRFVLDGAPIGTVSKPPYAVAHDFGDTLSAHRLSVEARTVSDGIATATVVSKGLDLHQRAGVDLVLVPVSVRGADGLPVRGLRLEDFVLLDDGVPRRIATFDAEPTPVSLTFVLDRSGSMRPYFPFVKAAAIRFLEQLPSFFSVSLISFSDDTHRDCDFTFDRTHLYYEINSQRAGGGTALFRASRASIASLRGRPGRRVAVLFTDGQDTVVPEENGEAAAGRILAEARAAGVMVFYVGYGWIDDARMLERIASGSGGAYLPAGGARLEGAFARIARELNAQYTLGFESAGQGLSGVWRSLRVEVRRPGLTVSARPGYAILPDPSR